MTGDKLLIISPVHLTGSTPNSHSSVLFCYYLLNVVSIKLYPLIIHKHSNNGHMYKIRTQMLPI